MKTIHEELKELGAIMDATTDEDDTRYREKFLHIKANYTTEEDVEVIADFIQNRYDALGKKLRNSRNN